MGSRVSGLIILCFLSCNGLFAQFINELTASDKTSLEGIIVEKYYSVSKEDLKDTAAALPKGAVTYRIYADLREGYHLQAVYGVQNHPMFLKTTTSFYNAKEGVQSADQLNDKNINEHAAALDSWVTIGMATKARFGVLKTEDTNGSVISRKGLDKQDGLLEGGVTQKLLNYGLDLSFFNKEKDTSYFYADNGSWAVIGGGKGPAKTNKVLIAQLTTNGKLSFELNVQIGTPRGNTVQFVAKDATGAEIQFKQLTYK